MVFVGVEVWGGRSHITYTAVDDGGRPPVVGKLLTEEGVTWARGHSGPAVDALLAAEALR